MTHRRHLSLEQFSLGLHRQRHEISTHMGLHMISSLKRRDELRDVRLL